MSRPPHIAIEPQCAPKASALARRNVDAALGLLLHLLTVSIVVAGILLAQAAAAQDRQSLMRDACLADYQRLCSSVAPGGGRIKQCMLERADELSPDCRSAILSRSLSSGVALPPRI